MLVRRMVHCTVAVRAQPRGILNHILALLAQRRDVVNLDVPVAVFLLKSNPSTTGAQYEDTIARFCVLYAAAKQTGQMGYADWVCVAEHIIRACEVRIALAADQPESAARLLQHNVEQYGFRRASFEAYPQVRCNLAVTFKKSELDVAIARNHGTAGIKGGRSPITRGIAPIRL